MSDNDIVTIPLSARRRAELAQLEREIGQASVGIYITTRIIDAIEVAAWRRNQNPDYDAIGKLIACRDLLNEESDKHYSRWRKVMEEDR